MGWQGGGAEGGRRRPGLLSDAEADAVWWAILWWSCAIHRCSLLRRCSQSAHFRAHALANGDGKLRKSTYVIDPGYGTIAA